MYKFDYKIYRLYKTNEISFIHFYKFINKFIHNYATHIVILINL